MIRQSQRSSILKLCALMVLMIMCIMDRASLTVHAYHYGYGLRPETLQIQQQQWRGPSISNLFLQTIHSQLQGRGGWEGRQSQGEGKQQLNTTSTTRDSVITTQSSDVPNQFHPVKPGFADDDFIVVGRNTSQGWVYFQYYSEANCAGDLTAYAGVRSGLCYAFNGSASSDIPPEKAFQSYQLVIYNETNCLDHLTIFYYTSTDCESNSEIFHTDLTSKDINMEICANADVIDMGNNTYTALTYEASLQLHCVFGDSIPDIDMPSVITE